MTRTGRSMLLCALLASLAGPLSASDGGYSLDVLVDGAAVPEYAARSRVYVEALKGKEFTLRITNPTNRRVAVALSVDGRNVIDAKRSSSKEAAKWVLGPWETIDVPGWQISGATARRFFFTETSKSYAKWLGDTANVGTIEAVFYRERERGTTPAARPPEEGRPRRRVPGRRLARRGGRAGRRAAELEIHRAAVAGRRCLRGDGHRRRDGVPGRVGRVRGGVLAGGPDRPALRVPQRARSPRRSAEAGRALRPRSRAWLRARVRTRSVPALTPPRGFAVESRRRFGGASRL